MAGDRTESDDRTKLASAPYLSGARLAAGVDHQKYPFNLPAVLALESIQLSQVTLLVGDNGSGKSTLIEALAVASGFNPEGGSKNLRFETYATHSELADGVVLLYNKRPRWGWFLRAETFYGMASHIHLDNDPGSGVRALFPDLHHKSHGESFLTLIEDRMTSNGLYLMDEPESALSFQGQLRLLSAMHEACQDGAQFIVATHSPILMAFPGAAMYEFDAEGASSVCFDESEAVTLWRNFLQAPERFFKHLFDAQPRHKPE